MGSAASAPQARRVLEVSSLELQRKTKTSRSPSGLWRSERDACFSGIHKTRLVSISPINQIQPHKRELNSVCIDQRFPEPPQVPLICRVPQGLQRNVSLTALPKHSTRNRRVEGHRAPMLTGSTVPPASPPVHQPRSCRNPFFWIFMEASLHRHGLNHSQLATDSNSSPSLLSRGQVVGVEVPKHVVGSSGNQPPPLGCPLAS